MAISYADGLVLHDDAQALICSAIAEQNYFLRVFTDCRGLYYTTVYIYPNKYAVILDRYRKFCGGRLPAWRAEEAAKQNRS